MRRLTRTGHFRDPNLEQQIERIRREALEEVALAEHERMTGGTHGIPRNSRFESTAGAQQKADKALADAKAYTDQEVDAAKDYTDQEVGSALSAAKDYTDANAQPRQGGETNDRPAEPRLYEMYFDTDLGIPVWWDGEDWVDAGGQVV